MKRILVVSLFLLTVTAAGEDKLPKEQIYALYNQANETFSQANSTNDPDQAERLYEKAILTFEKIVNQGQVKNAKLYYNLANAYLLHGELGKAILKP